MKWVALLCLLCSCGGNDFLLEPGKYTVTGTYTRDDWPGGEVGSTFDSEIKLSAKEGERDVYHIEVVGTSTEVDGLATDGILYFVKAAFDDRCGTFDSFFDTTLVPDNTKRSFTGSSNSGISLCNVFADGVCSCGELWFSVDLVGELQ